MTWALLFPGQGSQRAGMLGELPPGDSTERTLTQAAEVLGRPVRPDGGTPDSGAAAALDGPQAMRADTVAIQLALLIAGTATARALQARGRQPDLVAGHSVGAFTAAVAAGVLDFPDALRLVRLRGTLMAEAFPPDRGYGMVAFSGLPESRLRELAEQLRGEGEEVYTSNVNAPEQVAASGSASGLQRLTALARQAGARKAARLDVPVPAHCPLLAAVSGELAAQLATLRNAGRVHHPRCGFAGNAGARVLRRGSQVAADLAEAVARPVRWHDANTALYERGVRLFVEAAPGDTLSRLAGAAFPAARTIAADHGGLDSTVALLNR